LGTAQQIVTQYQYDEAGNETAQIDALNRVTTFAYDSMGRRIKRTLPGLQTETFGYDYAGDLSWHTNSNGAFITNAYDPLNRLLARFYPDGTSNAYTYTLTGQRLTMNDASGSYGYVYDLRDRLVTNTTPSGTLIYGYDANGNVTGITSSTTNGTLVTYQYDALNRLTNVIDGRLAGAQNTGYHFDLVGNLQGLQYPNGVTNLYQYDSLNRLTNLAWKLNATALGNFAYVLGPTGNRTSLAEFFPGTNRTYTWQYDALYRVTNEAVAGTNLNGSLSYTLDSVGNRLSRTNNLGTLGPQTFTYNSNDWINTDKYDSNGNTITNAVGQPCTYDFEDRLVSFNHGQVTLIYNSDGQRIQKVAGGVTTLYLVDTRNPSGYAQVLEELTVSGTTNLARAYTYGMALISQRLPGVTTNFYGTDGHGSARFLLNPAGSTTDTYTYDGYGNLIASTGGTSNKYLYCCEQFDPDLGFYYLRARYFNPNTGRFWTMDTAEGDQQDPKSLHKYVYCGGNPINGADPSGHDALDVALTVGLDLDTWCAFHPTLCEKPILFATGKFSPLAKKLLNNFMACGGTPIILTAQEMAAVRVTIDLRKSPAFSQVIAGLNGGQRSVSINNMTMLLHARESATLGRFIWTFNGKLTGSSPSSWQFSGTVNFNDIYKFDPQPYNNPNSPGYDPNGRETAAEWQVRMGNYWIPGKPFDVSSVAAPISQANSDPEAKWIGAGMPDHYVGLTY